MATFKQIRKWHKALRSRLPILGAIRRNWAMNGIESATDDPAVIPLLIEAFRSRDEEIAERAETALRALKPGDARDAFCVEWAYSRDPRLEAILLDGQYVASKPVEVRVLTALNCGMRISPVPAASVPFLVKLTDDGDETIAAKADSSLRKIENGEARDRLCELAIREPDGPAARICVEEQFRHSNPRQNALLLFVTDQLDAYFEQDFEFQDLRQAYDEADDTVRAHVLAVVRGGDRRCTGFFRAKSKTLTESSDDEIRLILETFQENSDHAALFDACLQLPLKYGVRIVDSLSKTDWQPKDPHLANLYKQLRQELGNTALPPPREPSVERPLFERWLAEGREMTERSIMELEEMIRRGSPVDGVKAVAAIQASGRMTNKVQSEISAHPHWLVRLAGHATGVALDIAGDTSNDPNLWVRELISAEEVLEFSPAAATPEDLDHLNRAPREAFTGHLGGLRRALRCILAYQVDTLVAKRPTKTVAEDAATFVRRKKS